MATRLLRGLCIVFSLTAGMSTASASDVNVLRGNANGGDGPVTILRGTPSQSTATEADSPARQQPVSASGVIGAGDSLWFVDSGGRIRACWLTGTGYVNSLKVVCTR